MANTIPVKFNRGKSRAVIAALTSGNDGTIYFANDTTGGRGIYIQSGAGSSSNLPKLIADVGVPSVGEHYTPAGGTALTPTSSGPATRGTTIVMTGITKDAAGHVTGVTGYTLPASDNTDRYVNQAAFSQDTTNNTVKMTLTRAGSDSATVAANLPVATTDAYGVTKLGTSATTAAKGNHTHSTSLATDTGTPAISLTANSTYKLTTGGTSVIFKTPADNDTKVTAVGNHYTPTGGSAATLTAGSAIGWGGSAITGINIDAAGHITGVTKGAIPSNPTSASISSSNTSTASGISVKTALSGTIASPVITPTVTVDTASLKTALGLSSPMNFKGTVGTNGTITWANLPAAAAGNTGDTYKVITDHAAETGKPAAKSGDTIVSSGTEWIVIPSGDEPSGTVTSVGLSVPTGLQVANSPITSSGTLAITYASGYSIPTTSKQTNWDTAYTNSHTHSNKTVLDGITSTKVSNWDNAVHKSGDETIAGAKTFTGTVTIGGTDVATGITAGTYGTITKVPQITINELGQVTGVTNTSIAFPAESSISISGGTAESGKYISALSADGHTITVTKASIPSGSGSASSTDWKKPITGVSLSGHTLSGTNNITIPAASATSATAGNDGYMTVAQAWDLAVAKNCLIWEES
mgnify:CR=1 FL=1